MLKSRLVKLGADKKSFAIVRRDMAELPNGILEAESILWNLWDVGVKFGQEYPSGIRFNAEPLILDLYDFRGARNSNFGFSVGRADKIGTVARILMFELVNGMQVFWDSGLEIPEVRQVIEEIDAYADSQSLIKNDIRLMDYNGAFGVRDAE
ncbi:MAG: hypothetical protein WC120_00780 [Parcubacteria group bacterium]